MNRTSVHSSSVVSVGYDPATMTLEVEFVGGGTYQYFDVPETEYQGLMAASSLGRHVNQQIKPKYRYASV